MELCIRMWPPRIIVLQTIVLLPGIKSRVVDLWDFDPKCIFFSSYNNTSLQFFFVAQTTSAFFDDTIICGMMRPLNVVLQDILNKKNKNIGARQSRAMSLWVLVLSFYTTEALSWLHNKIYTCSPESSSVLG